MSPRRRGKPAPAQVRIVGGRWRGRRLPVVAAAGLRPSGDRIRETLFNWLQFELTGCRCLDLFAGTGVLGLEALSRGAAWCSFVETDREALRGLRESVDALGVAGQTEVLARDALSWLALAQQPFDLVFIDPPFAQVLWEPVLTQLPRHLAPDALVYVEQPREHATPWSDDWEIVKDKQAGSVRFSLLRYAPREKQTKPE